MRLIDADKLNITEIYDENLKAHAVVLLEDIEDAPTVKAIPVEFIEAFKKEVRDVANGKAVIEWLLEEWGERKWTRNN